MPPHQTFSPEPPSSSRTRSVLLTSLLVFFIALDIGLLSFALAQPFDGFHGFQEAWYASIAKNYSTHSFFMPTKYDNTVDLNVPPLFSYFVWLSFYLLGQTEFAARLVPVAFALLAMVGVYLLGKRLLWKNAGLEAIALMASAPIFLILGRSVQTDIVFVSLSLFAMYFYLKAREKRLPSIIARNEATKQSQEEGNLSQESPTRKSARFGTVPGATMYLVAGLFLGAALFTKQFAVLPLAAIVTWELIGPERRRLVGWNFILFLLTAGLVVTPYYGYHLLHDPGALINAQLHGSASKASFATGSTFSFLVSEMLWACSPLFLIGSLAGLGLALVRPNRNKILIALAIGFFFLFFLFLHRHSYYFFGMVPFLALCFTELSERIPRRVYAISLVMTVAIGTALSAYELAGCKYGFGEFKAIGDYLHSYERPVVIADASFVLNYEPLFKYYSENATLMLRDSDPSPSEREALRNSDGIFSFSDFPMGDSAREYPIKGIRYGLKLGDRVYVHISPNPHFFTPALPTELSDYEVVGSFGPFVKLQQTSFYIVAEPISLRSWLENLWDAVKEQLNRGFR